MEKAQWLFHLAKAKWRVAQVSSARPEPPGHKNVILRACDFFDRFAFSARLPEDFSTHSKPVILSEAPRRSIAERAVYGAESKDPGDACWQMLFGAFQPQTSIEV
jgi:hypothetical protein